MPSTCDTERAGTVYRKLTEAAVHETLTAEDLGAAIAVVDRRSGQLTTSTGINWIAANVEFFVDAITSATDFFGRYIHLQPVMHVFNIPEIFGVLPLDTRFAFMKTAFQLHEPVDNQWVGVARQAGMPTHQLADLVRTLVESAEIDLRAAKGDYATSVFLYSGAGVARLTDTTLYRDAPGSDADLAEHWVLDEPDTLWSVLSNNELLEILRSIIAQEPRAVFQSPSPTKLFSLRQELLMRLAFSDVEQLLTEAADALTTFNSVDMHEFAWLPLEVQMRTADRLNRIPAELFITISLAIPDAYQAARFIQQNERALNVGRKELLRLAITYWHEFQPKNRSVRGKLLMNMLRHRLELNEFVVGVARQYVYQRSTRYKVDHGGVTYVRHRHQQDNPPKVGELVVFDTKTAQRLSPRKYAVEFIVLG